MSAKPTTRAALNGHEAAPGARGALPPNSVRVLATGLKRRWKRYRKGLKQCQEKFSESAVHASRVETRRLIAVLELLSPLLESSQVKRANDALKRHLDSFDDLRDTQVQLLAVRKLRPTLPAAADFCRYLRKREARFTRRTRKQVQGIKSKRLGKLITQFKKALRQWRSATCAPRANALLLGAVEGAFEKAWRLKENIDPQRTKTIHRTRIAFKKFRYMVETLADLLPTANDKLLLAMHRYQTMMGEIQDAEVLLRAFDKFGQKNHSDPKALARLRAELVRRRQWLLRVYLDAAHQLREFWPAGTVVSRSDRRRRSGPARRAARQAQNN